MRSDGKPFYDQPEFIREFNSLWEVTDSLAEASRKLEAPFRKSMAKNQALEAQVTQLNAELANTKAALAHSTSHAGKLEEESSTHREALARLLKKTHLLEEQNAKHLLEKTNLASALENERLRHQELQANYYTLEERLASSQARQKELAGGLGRYEIHCKELLEQLQQLRQLLEQTRQEHQRQLEDQQRVFETQLAELQPKIRP